MNSITSDRRSLVTGTAILVSGSLVALWLARASGAQLGWISSHIVHMAAVGVAFLAGIAVGVFIIAPRRPGGEGDSGGDDSVEPWTPGPDPIDLELHQMIDEQKAWASIIANA